MYNQPPYQNQPIGASSPPSGYTYYPEDSAPPSLPPEYASEYSQGGYQQQSVPPYQVPYASPAYPMVGFEPGRGQALAGLILSIVSSVLLLTFFGAFLNIILVPLALIFSALGLKSTTRHGFAVAGIVTAIIAALISILFIFFFIAILQAASNSSSYNY